ncbi:hypothetical protein RA20_04165 [Leisingera sp. ANG-Vp]|nr:hypothetical protein RA20_04165 [Leisingera sp. ANG-Vp]
MGFLSLVHLRAHGFDPQLRCAVGAAVLRTDEAPFQEALEHGKGAVGQHMAIARVAGDVAYFAAFQAFVMDGPAKGEFMQNTLLVL